MMHDDDREGQGAVFWTVVAIATVCVAAFWFVASR